MAGITKLTAAGIDTQAACAALGVSSATWYRGQIESPEPPQPQSRPPRALDDEQRKEVLDTLCEERFVDCAPAHVAATLLTEGKYLCSTRTMYRILSVNKVTKERRNQRRHPTYTKPELMARRANEVWSWDITRMLGPKKWSYFYLYVMMDIFSRYIVGWMVAETENASLAARVIEETYQKHGVRPNTLTIHSDRGTPMTAKSTAQLLVDLGVIRSLSRPQVSDDNPFSEAAFKTLKYHSAFPGRIETQLGATDYCREFFPWYNNNHCHSGIALLPPADVHFGRANDVLAQRQAALDAAYRRHPERFTAGPPRVPTLPSAVYINPPNEVASELPADAP